MTKASGRNLFSLDSPGSPGPLASHVSWKSFHDKLCASPLAALSPAPYMQDPPSYAPAALDSPVNQAEVLRALRHLGMARPVAGLVGLQILSFCAPDDSARMKLWALASLLTAMLNISF